LTSADSSPLLHTLYSEETVDLLLEQVLKPGNTYGFRAGMAVISQLLRALGNSMHDSDMSGNVSVPISFRFDFSQFKLIFICSQVPVPHDAPLEALPLVVRKVVFVLPRLNELLVAPPKTRTITNQLGKLMEERMGGLGDEKTMQEEQK
jgi:hypothetical protein